MTQPTRDEAMVATMRSLRVFSRQAEYPGFTGGNLQEMSGLMTR